MAERLAQVEARLGDVTRQRVLGRIQQALADEQRERVRWRRWRVVASAVAAALVLAASWTLLHEPQAARVASSLHPAAKEKSVTTPALGVALSPFLVAGTNGERAARLLARAHTELSLAPGERLWAQLGQRARLALVGPARVRLRALGADGVALELEEGTLLGDYDHARGGLLSIRSPDTVTEVVGTVFLVQTSAGRTRVAVAEGAVRVQRGDKRISVTRAQALPADADALEQLPLADQVALREHSDGFIPAPGAQGILGITGPQLRASVAGRSLGETPLWVRMAVGAHTIALSSLDGSQRQVHATVRPQQETDMVMTEAVIGADVAAKQPPSESSHERRVAKRAPVAADASRPGPTELYRDAERAMRAAELARASALLAQLVREHPRAPSVDLALYELAELSLRAQDYGSARRWLAQLDEHGARPALDEPTTFLRCQSLGPDQRAPSYLSCIEALRTRFPDSPHLR